MVIACLDATQLVTYLDTAFLESYMVVVEYLVKFMVKYLVKYLVKYVVKYLVAYLVTDIEWIQRWQLLQRWLLSVPQLL